MPRPRAVESGEAARGSRFLAEQQDCVPRKILHELAAEAPAVANLFAVPHAELDRSERPGKIGGPYGKQPADFCLLRHRQGQAGIDHRFPGGLCRSGL